MSYLWLAVTADKYELPIFVTDSSSKLAKKLGLRATNIIAQANKNSGRNKGIKFIKLYMEEEV